MDRSYHSWGPNLDRHWKHFSVQLPVLIGFLCGGNDATCEWHLRGGCAFTMLTKEGMLLGHFLSQNDPRRFLRARDWSDAIVESEEWDPNSNIRVFASMHSHSIAKEHRELKFANHLSISSEHKKISCRNSSCEAVEVLQGNVLLT